MTSEVGKPTPGLDPKDEMTLWGRVAVFIIGADEFARVACLLWTAIVCVALWRGNEWFLQTYWEFLLVVWGILAAAAIASSWVRSSLSKYFQDKLIEKPPADASSSGE